MWHVCKPTKFVSTIKNAHFFDEIVRSFFASNHNSLKVLRCAMSQLMSIKWCWCTQLFKAMQWNELSLHFNNFSTLPRTNRWHSHKPHIHSVGHLLRIHWMQSTTEFSVDKSLDHQLCCTNDTKWIGNLYSANQNYIAQMHLSWCFTQEFLIMKMMSIFFFL